MDFCKQFNAQTAHISPGVPTPTIITINPDRSFSFITRTPPTSWLLKQCGGIEKGTGKPGKDWAGTVTLKHVYEIAKIKKKDEHMAHLDEEAIARMICGSARSLGLRVIP
jgi:large subunit ribosomal protein L11